MLSKPSKDIVNDLYLKGFTPREIVEQTNLEYKKVALLIKALRRSNKTAVSLHKEQKQLRNDGFLIIQCPHGDEQIVRTKNISQQLKQAKSQIRVGTHPNASFKKAFEKNKTFEGFEFTKVNQTHPQYALVKSKYEGIHEVVVEKRKETLIQHSKLPSTGVFNTEGQELFLIEDLYDEVLSRHAVGKTFETAAEYERFKKDIKLKVKRKAMELDDPSLSGRVEYKRDPLSRRGRSYYPVQSFVGLSLELPQDIVPKGAVIVPMKIQERMDWDLYKDYLQHLQQPNDSNLRAAVQDAIATLRKRQDNPNALLVNVGGGSAARSSPQTEDDYRRFGPEGTRADMVYYNSGGAGSKSWHDIPLHDPPDALKYYKAPPPGSGGGWNDLD